MPLKYKTLEQLSAQINAEFKTNLPSIDPTIFGHWALSLANGNAVLAQSIQEIVEDLEKQMFPQTATDEFLDQWGWYEDLARIGESPSSGEIVITGTDGTLVPANTAFTGSNGIGYETDADVTIITTEQSVQIVGAGSGVAIGVTPSPHGFATGMTVEIVTTSGVDFSGIYVVTVYNTTNFGFSTATTGAGTGTVTIDKVTATVNSTTDGFVANLSSGAIMTLNTSISGVDNTALVLYTGIIGGADDETDDEYRARIMLSRSIREGVFTPDQIKLAVFGVPGNTRVWVKKPLQGALGGSTTPKAGQCSVFFLRDGESSISPTVQNILDTFNAVIANGKLPANMVEEDLFVQGPQLVPEDFEFDTLNPDTPTMRTAVENTLAAFFEDTVNFEETVTVASYLGAIQNTQDLETGAWISTFSLIAPTTDITVSAGQIAALGSVTWSII